MRPQCKWEQRPTGITLGFSGRTAAITSNNGEFQSLWAGTRFRECREETVIELIERLF
ncbi:MAG: hypothetical protein OEY09_07380 [Gammaproteobacteria bacterium]|nr:hypothetical protein [Gammaproteobacteria bacterium]